MPASAWTPAPTLSWYSKAVFAYQVHLGHHLTTSEWMSLCHRGFLCSAEVNLPTTITSLSHKAPGVNKKVTSLCQVRFWIASHLISSVDLIVLSPVKNWHKGMRVDRHQPPAVAWFSVTCSLWAHARLFITAQEEIVEFGWGVCSKREADRGTGKEGRRVGRKWSY